MNFTDLLAKNRDRILKSIDPRGDLLIQMISEDLIDYDDRDRIKQGRERRTMAEDILEMVSNKAMDDPSVGEKFRNCLTRSGQKHVATLLDEHKQDVATVAPQEAPMSEDHRRLLQRELVRLVQNTDSAGDLLSQLHSLHVLNGRDLDKIRTQKSVDEMNEVLLADIIPFKPDAAFGLLVKALRESDQPHVANILAPNNECVEHLMSSNHRQFLVENLVHLSRTIEPNYGLMQLLLSRNIISELDAQRIKVQSTTDAMNESLIRILTRKSDSMFLKFLTALKDSNQAHILTSCYGHNINVTLDLNISDPSERSKAEESIITQLPDKLLEVECNTVELIRQKCVLVTLRCPTVECLRDLWTKKQENKLAEYFQGPIDEILESVGIASQRISVNIDQNEYNSCLRLFKDVEMSAEHRNFLARRQFDPDLLISNDLLNQLHLDGVLRRSELLQITNQLRLDDRRDRLFDALRRKQDGLFDRIQRAFKLGTDDDDDDDDDDKPPQDRPGLDLKMTDFNTLLSTVITTLKKRNDYPGKKELNIFEHNDSQFIFHINTTFLAYNVLANSNY